MVGSTAGISPTNRMSMSSDHVYAHRPTPAVHISPDQHRTASYPHDGRSQVAPNQGEGISVAGGSSSAGRAGSQEAERGSGKRKRPYGLSCLACREKKTSCDGVRPRCSGCMHTSEECVVPPPQRTLRRFTNASSRDGNGSAGSSSSSTASVRYLLQRIRQSEARIKQLEESTGQTTPTVSATSRKPAELNWAEDDGDSGEEDEALSAAENGQGNTTWGGPVAMSNGAGEEGSEVQVEGARYQLQMDEGGNVVYHGLTGWSQGPQYASPNSSTLPAGANAIPGFADPTFAPFFQALASHKHISVAPEIGDTLLLCFFNYQVFETIHQPLFMRDMALNGPYFSEFLLMAIYAAATRKIDGLNMADRAVQGELFMKLAKEYLMKDLEKPPTVPLIQGLLLLSSTQLAEGQSSGGWLHAGMAFRMIMDLGIHLAPEAVQGAKQLSSEDQTMRDRLFWAAFIWDKSISLALGREPTLAPRLGKTPSTLPDYDDEDEAWSPYFRHTMNRPWQLGHYSYQPKRRATWLRLSAGLCLILHDIIMDLYSTESRLTPRQRLGVCQRIRSRLDELWEKVPQEAKYSGNAVCPPPNVFMFQMLFHATCILVGRTDITPADITSASKQTQVSACEQHSIQANLLARGFTETFGERMTYVAVYSLFVAASFDIVLLDSPSSDTRSAALSRLKEWMEIMDKSSSRVPSIRRSVQHISTSVCNAVTRNPVLASSEPGSWILAKYTQQDQQIQLPMLGMPYMPEMQAETGVFDFFDLLGPT